MTGKNAGMKPLPMPLRIAAGLVATALEEVQELPRKLTELPVTAVSQALQASMRLQQRVTELAIKGDRALGALRPVPETPTWARFDEDEELGSPRNGLTNGLRYDDLPRPPKVTPVRILPDLSDTVAPDISEVPAPRPPAEHPDTALLTQPTETDGASTKPSTKSEPKPRTKPSTRSNAKPSTKSDAKPRGKSDSAPSAEPSSDVQLAAAATAEPATAEPTTAEPAAPEQPETVAQPAASGPPGLTEYEQWSLPQLRGRFRALSVGQLEQLLAWETSHQDRPPFVTMLSNRITSVTGR